MKKDNSFTRKQAVALSWNADHNDAPIVTAKGSGKTAEKIIEKANEHSIPIQEDSSLVSLLQKLNLNDSIPEELYRAVAEVFAFVYSLDQSSKNDIKSDDSTN